MDLIVLLDLWKEIVNINPFSDGTRILSNGKKEELVTLKSSITRRKIHLGFSYDEIKCIKLLATITSTQNKNSNPCKGMTVVWLIRRLWDTNFIFFHSSSETALTWFAMDFSEDEANGQLEHLAVRFKLAETKDDFKKAFEDAQKKIANKPPATIVERARYARV